MNSDYLIDKNRLKGFLKEVMKDYRLITPQLADKGDFLFQETQNLEKIELDYDITSNTLKEFFFLRKETIFRYEKKTDNSVKIIPVKETRSQKTIFFGVHSCDIRAVYFHDRFFNQEPKDALYWQKRNNSILISLACNQPPRQSCFCIHTHNGSPFLEKGDGFDLQFIDLAKMYLVEVGTAKGEGLIKKYKRFFSSADEKSLDKKSYLKKRCLVHFPKKYDVIGVYNKLKRLNLVNLWKELGKRCTNCGGCEFICPTCFCFYTHDIEYSKEKGERIKTWDSCTFSGYSRMAGDINPHEKNSDRINRRFFCKLYNCYNWFEVFGCTGCGRCAFVCPVNLDMESFINSLMSPTLHSFGDGAQSDKYQPLLKEL